MLRLQSLTLTLMNEQFQGAAKLSIAANHSLRSQPLSFRVMISALKWWGFFDSDGVGPFGDEGVSFFHRHPGILHKHLRAFAATPGEIVEEVLPADAVRACWGIHSRLAAFDEAGQIVHCIPRFRDPSMQDGRTDFQLA